MLSLSSETILHLLGYLDINDLLCVQLVSRHLNALSSEVLYQNVSTDDVSVGRLHQTLSQNRSLAACVKKLAINRRLQVFPNFATAKHLQGPVIDLCADSLQSLEVDMYDMCSFTDNSLLETLPKLTKIRKFSLKGAPASIPFSSMYPALAIWAEQLQSLEIVGLCAGPPQGDVSYSPLKLEKLKNFTAKDNFELEDWQLESLLGHSNELTTLALHMLVSDAPSSAAVLQIVKRNGNSIVNLSLSQPYKDRSSSGADLFGNEAVRSCRKGVLRQLELSGQIFNKELFTLAQMEHLTTLELGWVSTISFSDIKQWLERVKPAKLENLTAKQEAYDDDMVEGSVVEAFEAAMDAKIKVVDLGAVYGPWRPPLAPASRRASYGEIDV